MTSRRLAWAVHVGTRNAYHFGMTTSSKKTNGRSKQ